MLTSRSIMQSLRRLPTRPLARVVSHRPGCVCGCGVGIATLASRSLVGVSKAPVAKPTLLSSRPTLAASTLLARAPARSFLVDPSTLPPNIKLPMVSQEYAANGRPISPHIAIYNMSLVAYVSFVTRMTGAVLTFGFYCLGIYGLTHWSAPDAIIAWATAHPFMGFFAKGIVAFPFIWHIIGGFRHLYWDSVNKHLDMPSVDKSSRQLLAITAGLTLLLMLITFSREDPEKKKQRERAKQLKAIEDQDAQRKKPRH